MRRAENFSTFIIGITPRDRLGLRKTFALSLTRCAAAGGRPGGAGLLLTPIQPGVLAATRGERFLTNSLSGISEGLRKVAPGNTNGVSLPRRRSGLILDWVKLLLERSTPR